MYQWQHQSLIYPSYLRYTNNDIIYNIINLMFVGMRDQMMNKQKMLAKVSLTYNTSADGGQHNLTPVGVLKKVLYGEAPPRGPTPYPFIYHFFRKITPFVYFLLKKRHPFHIPSYE